MVGCHAILHHRIQIVFQWERDATRTFMLDIYKYMCPIALIYLQDHEGSHQESRQRAVVGTTATRETCNRVALLSRLHRAGTSVVFILQKDAPQEK